MNFLVCDLSLIDNPTLISDRFVSYEDGDYEKHWNNYPNEHALNSWHGYAAAMKGRFVSAPLDNWVDHIKWADFILFTVTYNCKMALQTIEQVKKMGKKMILAFHENGDRMFSLIKQNLQWALDFRDCANKCDFLLSYPNTTTCEVMYKGMGVTTPIVRIVSPYWTEKMKDFAYEKKSGCFIGPLKKDQELERRNWFLNVTCAIGEFGKSYYRNRITTINASSQPNEEVSRILNKLIPEDKKELHINVIGKLGWYDFLKELSTYEVTINLDSSDTNGQVDIDSLFVGTPLINPLGYYFTDHGKMWEKFKSSNDYKIYENLNLCRAFMDKLFSYDKCRYDINALWSVATSTTQVVPTYKYVLP